MLDRYHIGVDPDAEASGVAVLFKEDGRTFLQLHTLTFPEAVQFIRGICARHAPVSVHVEAGWLNTGNWHVTRYDSAAKCAAMGVAVGRNQETGRKLIEMLRYYGISCNEVRPLKKCWRGKDGKISHAELASFAPVNKTRTNQEERDAALIAWTQANLPIAVPVLKK